MVLCSEILDRNDVRGVRSVSFFEFRAAETTLTIPSALNFRPTTQMQSNLYILVRVRQTNRRRVRRVPALASA
jgi:hypothetical protein